MKPEDLTEDEIAAVTRALKDANSMIQGLLRAIKKRSKETTLLSIETIIIRVKEAQDQISTTQEED